MNLVKIQGLGDMSSLELLLVDDEMMEVLKYCMQMLKIIEQKYGAMLRDEEDADEDILGEATKKLTIFMRSTSKMKNSC